MIGIPLIILFLGNIGCINSDNITSSCVGADVSIKFVSFPKVFSIVEWTKQAPKGPVVLIAKMQKIFHVSQPFIGRFVFLPHGGIKLKNVTVNDEGNYTRTVFNGASRTEETTELIVLVPPIGKPSIIKLENKKTMVCKNPTYIGKPEIKLQLSDKYGVELNTTVAIRNEKHTYVCCMKGIAADCLPPGKSRCTSVELGNAEIKEQGNQLNNICIIISSTASVLLASIILAICGRGICGSYIKNKSKLDRFRYKRKPDVNCYGDLELQNEQDDEHCDGFEQDGNYHDEFVQFDANHSKDIPQTGPCAMIDDTDFEESDENTPFQRQFIKAVIDQSENDILNLIKRGGNIHTAYRNGQMLIHYAAKTENVKILRIFLSHGLSAFSINNKGQVPLHIACIYGCLSAVQTLTNQKQCQFITDVNHKTPIFYAVENNHFEVVKSLLNTGSRLTDIDANNKTLLHYASYQKNEGMIRYLLNFEQIKWGMFEVCIRQLEVAIDTANDFLGSLVIQPIIEKYFESKRDGNLQTLIELRTKEILEMLCQCIRGKKIKDADIIDVWPAYRDINTGPVFLVVYVKDMSVSKIDFFMGLKVIYRLYDYVNEEARVIMSSNFAKENELSISQYLSLKKIIDKNFIQLRKQHSNLTFLAITKVKSSQNGRCLKPSICIALHCRYKGMIPFLESLFPTNIEGYDTDIREGYITIASLANPHYNKNPPSYARHNILRIGCSVGSYEMPFSSGTIGAFAEVDNKPHFLTSAHLFFKLHECVGQTISHNTDLCPRVQQPSKGDPSSHGLSPDELYCGRVILSVFDVEKSVSVDAALVEIAESRCPEGNETIGLNQYQLKQCGFADAPDLSRIFVLDVLDDFEACQNTVFKIGSGTGITRGVITLLGTSGIFETSNAVSIEDMAVSLKNQIEILPIGGNPFAAAGDSGSSVFMKKDGKYYCLGMINAYRSDGIVLVSPIQEVCKCLNLPISSLMGYTIDA